MGRSSKLYNSDLAPTPASKKNWGWFEIFNVWANDVQSLFGYTLAASLFLASGLNGWAVFAALILAGFFIMWLVNLSGKPSVKHGIPYPYLLVSAWVYLELTFQQWPEVLLQCFGTEHKLMQLQLL